MSLPRIQAINPVQTPARAAKLYPDLYMRTLRIDATPDAPWRAVAELAPYDYESNSLAPAENVAANTQVMQIADLQAEAQRSPVVAQILGGVLTVINLLSQERANIATLALALRRLQEASALPDTDPTKASTIAANEQIRDQADAALAAIYQQLAINAT